MQLILKNNDRPIYGDYETHKITYFLPVVGMLFPNQVVYYGETFACLRKRLLKLEPDTAEYRAALRKLTKKMWQLAHRGEKFAFENDSDKIPTLYNAEDADAKKS